MIKEKLKELFFPSKCVLCGKVLKEQTDLCHSCRSETEEFTKSKKKISFVAGWRSLWYYTDKVRHSIILYKFYNRRSYGKIYGRLLAMQLKTSPLCEYDLLTWVPVSSLRRWRRGYDQAELIAVSVGQELETPATALLKKIRHTKPQSRLQGIAQRKANVMGAFAVTDPTLVRNKRILLIDDILTTGATVSECSRVLLTAGAKEVYCAFIGASDYQNNVKHKTQVN